MTKDVVRQSHNLQVTSPRSSQHDGEPEVRLLITNAEIQPVDIYLLKRAAITMFTCLYLNI